MINFVEPTISKDKSLDSTVSVNGFIEVVLVGSLNLKIVIYIDS
jgi:hypothetical protein